MDEREIIEGLECLQALLVAMASGQDLDLRLAAENVAYWMADQLGVVIPGVATPQMRARARRGDVRDPPSDDRTPEE